MLLSLQLHQYQYYSTGLLSNYDKFPEHNKLIAGPKKKISKEYKKMERKMKGVYQYLGINVHSNY